jgi:energy-coupling factor transporter ATP-binding protein EcfA2
MSGRILKFNDYTGNVSESVEPILEYKKPILEDAENVSSKSEESIPDESIPLGDKEPILEDAENISSKSEESIPEESKKIKETIKETSKETSKETIKETSKETSKETFNNMIITGPNGSGKSTYIKSIIECIILGQTIGVVPAKQFELTPFKNITTYLNIPDCQGKESLFQAEMNRCHQQLEMLENAETNGEFSFNIMDEIFVSTNYQEGMSGAYAVINQLCKFKNCLNIITTHFDVLANMNELKVDKQYFDIDIVIEDCDNNADKDGAEKFIKDYKIKPGVSKKHMALKLLKNKGFSADIIKDAEYLYEKIKNAK